MTKIAKLHAWIVANPRASIPFREFERLLQAFGFVLDRTTGSHRQYVNRRSGVAISVQPLGKDAKSYQVRQFLAICRERGLELDER